MYAMTLNFLAGFALTLDRSRTLPETYIVWLESLVEDRNDSNHENIECPSNLIQASIEERERSGHLSCV